MMFALVNGVRSITSPGLTATCPGCGAAVIPKCGSIRTWHWAHTRADCDSWYEPEGAWHREWKVHWPPDQVEVCFGPHRADIATSNRVIELQHSPISPADIAAREEFYSLVRPQGMIWLIDGTEIEHNFEFTPADGFVRFRWKRCPAHWLLAARPRCVDFGTGIFIIKKMRGRGYGWGYAVSQSKFISVFD